MAENENTIDTLVIKVEGEDKSAKSTLDSVLKKLEAIKKAATGSNSMTAFTKRLDSIKSSIEGIKSEKLSAVSSFISSLNNAGNISISPRVPERIREIGDAVRALDGVDFSQMNAMADGFAALSRVGNVRLPRITSQRQDNAGQPVPTDYNGTEQVTVTEESVSRASRFSEKIAEIREKITAASSATRAFGRRARDAFSDTIVGRFSMRIKGLITSFGRIAMYRVMRSMIKQVTDAFKTGIDDMYQYSKTFNGNYARSMDQLASANLTYKNSIGAIMAPIIERVVPWLDKVIDRLVDINNTAAMVIAGLSGKSTYSKAVRVTTEYAAAAKDAAGNTSKITDKVKELKRSFAGLDEITVIGQNLSDTISSVADNSNGLDYSSMFVETPVDMAKVNEIKEKFEDILTIVGLIGAGIAAWNLTKAISNLTGLSGLNSALTLAGVTLTFTGATLIFKGIKDVITDGMDWESFWTLFFGGASLTAGTTVLGKVISRITGNANWTGIGARVGAGVWGAAFAFSGIYDTITNTIDSGKGNLESSLTSLFSTIIGGALIGTAISPGFGTAIGAVGGAIVNGVTAYISNPKTVQGVKDALREGKLVENVKAGLYLELTKNMGVDSETAASISKWFSDAWVKPAQDTYRFWVDTKNWAKETWDSITEIWNGTSDWFNCNVITPVSDFFSGLWTDVSGFFSGLWDDVKGIWNLVSTWFDTNVITPISRFFSQLWDGISKGAHDIWVIISAAWQTASVWFDTNVITPIKNFFVDLWSKISNFASDAWNSCVGVWNSVSTWFEINVIQPVSGFFSNLWKDVSGFFSDLWEDVKGIWNKAASWFDENVITPVSDYFSWLWTSVSGFFSGLWEDIKSIWDKVDTWFDTNVIQPVSDAFETVTSTISGFFSDCWTGIKNAAATAINWVIGGIEDAINGIINGVNWFIGKFNGIGEWASKVTGQTFYYVQEFQPVSLGRVQAYKEGGFPEDGLFFANHNELIGQFSNGKTAVANNEQIVEGIAGGVASANEETNRLLTTLITIGRQLLEKDSTIDVSTITRAMNQKNRRDGKVTVPVGT